MKCVEFLKELTEYLDGTTNVELRAELDEHMHWCHSCHVVVNTTRKTIEIYRDNRVYELPESLRSRLQEAILRKCKSSTPTGKPSA